MKLNLFFIGLDIILLLLVWLKVITFGETLGGNISAALLNGFFYGSGLVAVANLVALKFKKE